MAVSFAVTGIPVPKGSKRLVRGRMVEAHPKVKVWMKAVRSQALLAVTGPPSFPSQVPVSVFLCFAMPRPKSVSPRKRWWPSVTPDIDKITRAILDALTGVVFYDDAQVCVCITIKRYVEEAESPGVAVWVDQLATPYSEEHPGSDTLGAMMG